MSVIFFGPKELARMVAVSATVRPPKRAPDDEWFESAAAYSRANAWAYAIQYEDGGRGATADEIRDAFETAFPLGRPMSASPEGIAGQRDIGLLRYNLYTNAGRRIPVARDYIAALEFCTDAAVAALRGWLEVAEESAAAPTANHLTGGQRVIEPDTCITCWGEGEIDKVCPECGGNGVAR